MQSSQKIQGQIFCYSPFLSELSVSGIASELFIHLWIIGQCFILYIFIILKLHTSIKYCKAFKT